MSETVNQPQSDLGFEYNPYEPGFDANPFPIFKQMQEKAPVYFWNTAQAWLLSKLDDIVNLMRDPRFSLDRKYWEFFQPTTFKPEHADYVLMLDNGLWNVSKSDHARIRRLVGPAFSPRAVAKMRDLVQQTVDSALASFEGQEIADISTGFAEPIPMGVMCKLVRIPDEAVPIFRAFAFALLEASSAWIANDEFDRIIAPVSPGVQLLRKLIHERREKPGDDLLSDLIRARDEEAKLSEGELISLVNALIAAGTETTTDVICLAVYNLLRHPDQLRRLRSDWSLIGKACDEVIRYDGLGKVGVPRYALEDVEIRGTKITKGKMVIGLLSAGLRDPEVYANPDVFDITRDNSNSPHYGVGAHICVGAHLARLEIETAVRSLFERYPNMELVEEPTFGRHSYLRQISSLKVRLNRS